MHNSRLLKDNKDFKILALLYSAGQKSVYTFRFGGSLKTQP